MKDHHETIAQTISRNTFFNIIARVVEFASGFILAPYLIHRLGLERFGLYSIVGIVVQYLALCQFGLNASFVRYIATFSASNDFNKIGRLLWTGIIIFFPIVVTIAFIVYLQADTLIKLLSLSASLIPEAVTILKISCFTFVLSMVTSVFASIPEGMQRMDISCKLRIYFTILNFLCTILVINLGYGIIGILYMNVATGIIILIVHFIIANHLIEKSMRLMPVFDKGLASELYNYGIKVWTSSVAGTIHFHIDKLFIAHYLNFSLVAVYELASRVAAALREIPQILISALLPAAAKLSESSSRKSIEGLLCRAQKYMMMIIIPFFIYMFFMSDYFFTVWIGNEIEKIDLTFKILLIAYFVNALTGPTYFILNGIGYPKIGMTSSIFASVAHLVASFVLLKIYGYTGLLSGTLISMIMAACLFFYIVKKQTQFNLSWIHLMTKPIMSSFVLSFTFKLLTSQYHSNLPSFLAGIIFCSIGSWMALYFLNYFDEFDLNLFKKFMRLKFQ